MRRSHSSGWFHVFGLLAIVTATVPLSANGGDTCATATVITSLPFTDIGSNCGFINNFTLTPCTGSERGPDVVYSYAPPVDQALRIGLCEATSQARLYVFRDTCGAAYQCGVLSCTNQLGQPTPRIEVMQVHANHTYYIVIDSPDASVCTQVFHLSIEAVECEPCPPGAIDENEPNCGLDAVGNSNDDTNGGCAGGRPLFTSISNGQTVCGTVAANAATDDRDTDWYEVQLSGPSRLMWTIMAQTNLVVGVPDHGGVADCQSIKCLSELTETAYCVPSVITMTRSAGEWWLFLVLPADSGVMCGTPYRISLAVDPITADINDDASIDGIDLGILLAGWTLPPQSPACDPDHACDGDLNLDGTVNGVDLGMLLSAWNPG